MGYYVRAYERWIESDLSHGAFRLLCLVAMHARRNRQDGVCRAGTAQLAREMRTDARVVRRYLAKLEAGGYLTRIYGGESGCHIDGITLCPEPSQNQPPAVPVHADSEVRVHADKNVPPRGHLSPRDADKNAPHADKNAPHADSEVRVDADKNVPPRGLQSPRLLKSKREEEEVLREKNTQTACVCVPATDAPVHDADIPAHDAHARDHRGEVIDLDGGERPDPKEVDRVARLADQLHCNLRIGMGVRQYAALYPLAWLERAVAESASWADRPRTFTPIYRMLQRWAAQGGPPEIVTDMPRAPGGQPARKVGRMQAQVDEFKRLAADATPAEPTAMPVAPRRTPAPPPAEAPEEKLQRIGEAEERLHAIFSPASDKRMPPFMQRLLKVAKETAAQERNGVTQRGIS